MIEDPCYICGADSDYGCHGIKNGEAYSEYFCNKHYNAHGSLKLAQGDEDEEVVADRRSTPEDNSL